MFFLNDFGEDLLLSCITMVYLIGYHLLQMMLANATDVLLLIRLFQHRHVSSGRGLL